MIYRYEKEEARQSDGPLVVVCNVCSLFSYYAVCYYAVCYYAVASNGVNANAIAVNGLSLSGLVTTRSERNSNYSCENKS